MNLLIFANQNIWLYTHTIQSDEVWLANAQKLLDKTGDIPLGLYETPVPKVRLDNSKKTFLPLMLHALSSCSLEHNQHK